jgi:hypothetical protein
VLHRARSALLLPLLLLVVSGCEVRTDVVLHAEPDGTGRIEVAVALDAEAAARAAGVQVQTQDLTRAGWEVHPPVRTEGGGVVYRAEKRFRSPEEADRVVRETSGSALRGFTLTRQRSFLRTRTRLRGTIDLRGGAATFGDPALTELLGGQALGLEPDRVEPLDKALRLHVTAELPGRTARWTARSGSRVPLDVTAEQWNVASIAFAVVAGLALTAFVVSLRRALRRPAAR